MTRPDPAVPDVPALIRYGVCWPLSKDAPIHHPMPDGHWAWWFDAMAIIHAQADRLAEQDQQIANAYLSGIKQGHKERDAQVRCSRLNAGRAPHVGRPMSMRTLFVITIAAGVACVGLLSHAVRAQEPGRRYLYDVIDVAQTPDNGMSGYTELWHVQRLKTCVLVIDRGLGTYGRGTAAVVVPCPWTVKP